ncbi:hypothetical protein AB0F77_03720 [Streptomyces sp. NPDC026672]|uniref:hypothetical protein n=1 Tax=unclassified Streptomyces TaxID=2593676 RepID=UPI0034046120
MNVEGRRPVLSAAAVALLLTGCTSGGQNDESGGSATPSAGPGASGSSRPGGGDGTSPDASASPSASTGPYTLTESAAPRTRAEAEAMVRGLTVQPDYFGSGYRKRDPYEAGPTTWAVLGEDCVWRREQLPSTVLASLTRSFVRPAAAGKGPVYVSLTVTVHTSVLQARRDMASSLEEPMRCPEQRLNATDRVRGMFSSSIPYAEERTAVSDDDLTEFGEYVVDAGGPARGFDWSKHRLGPVTVAATVRHAPGESEAEQTAITQDALGGVAFVSANVDRSGRDGTAGKTGKAGQDATASGDETKDARDD